MGPPKPAIRATYERIAESFAATRNRPWPEVEAFIDRLPADSRVLDLGCGNGRHAKLLAGRGHRVIGLDFSRRLLAIGRRDTTHEAYADRMSWIEGEATALPFRDSSFDASTCVAVLHHLPTSGDRVGALLELRRVLRVGALAFLSVWSREQPRFDSVAGSSLENRDGDVQVPWMMPVGSVVLRFYHVFREGELERLIIESGLHGERFFRGSGNYFALATNDG